MDIRPSQSGIPHRRLPTSATIPDATRPETLESCYEKALLDARQQREALPIAWRKTGYPTPTSARSALLITASALAYQCENDIRTALKNAPCGQFEDVEVFYMRDACPADEHAGTPGDPRRKHLRAFGFVDRDNAYLVFKGTQGCIDWLLNFQFWMIGRPARHAGFHRAWRSISTGVEEWIRRPGVAGKTLHVAGHSLGGAMAVLASYELAAAGIPLGNVVTVGQPRVGGRSFKAAYDGPSVRNAEGNPLSSRYESYVHGADPVPWKPPWWLGFSHVRLPQKLDIQLLFPLPVGTASETPFRIFDKRTLVSLALKLLTFAPAFSSLAQALVSHHSDHMAGAALDAVAKHKSIGYVEIMAPGTLLTPAAINDEGSKLKGHKQTLCWTGLFVPIVAIACVLLFAPDQVQLIGLGFVSLVVASIMIWNWIRG